MSILVLSPWEFSVGQRVSLSSGTALIPSHDPVPTEKKLLVPLSEFFHWRLFTAPGVSLPNTTYKESTPNIFSQRQDHWEYAQGPLLSAAATQTEDDSNPERKSKTVVNIPERADATTENYRSLWKTWLCIAMEIWMFKALGAPQAL